MAIQPMALAVDNPAIDTFGAYQKGRATAIDEKTAQISQAGAQQQQDFNAQDQKRKGLEALATMSLGVLGGDLNGKADPQRWDQALNLLQMHGADPTVIQQLRGHPEMANQIAQSTLQSLQAAQSMAATQQKLNAPTEVAQGASLMNPQTGAVVGTAPIADKTAALPTSYREFQLAKDDPEYAKTLASSSSKPPTDAQRRASQLTEVVKPDADLLLGDGTPQNPGIFDALSNGWDQAGAVLTGGRLSGEAYQRAANAVGNIAQSYLYAVSGQAAPAAEVAKIVDSVSPKFGDKPQTLKEKKARLKSYVDAIALGQKQGVNATQPTDAAPAGGADLDPSTLSDEDLLTMLGQGH